MTTTAQILEAAETVQAARVVRDGAQLAFDAAEQAAQDSAATERAAAQAALVAYEAQVSSVRGQPTWLQANAALTQAEADLSAALDVMRTTMEQWDGS